ncbi:hypothetical protein ACFEMC_00370 [Kineococcus sp. DHX-1]|uniref:hypothetical protein n=1 Tax=Kineococcus sp. DHX-1 TaxID=3349638 RepID=UPI0036D3CC61
MGASIVLYRKQDWIDWLGQYQQDVEMEFAGNAEGGDFGFMIGPEYLLERPHAHRWCIDDAPALQASVRHVSELIRTRLEPLIPRLVERLPNTKGFLAGQDFLEIPKKARLGMREKCPWAPCVEPGRRLDAGGVVRLGDGFPEYSTGSS